MKNTHRVPFLKKDWSYPEYDQEEDDQEKYKILDSRHREITDAMNVREIGLYPQNSEFDSGQKLFETSNDNPNKLLTVFRKVIVWDSQITSFGTVQQAHGISNLGKLLSLKASGKDDSTGKSYIIPHASPVGNENIEIHVDQTNINIVKGAGITQLDNLFVILDYTRG